MTGRRPVGLGQPWQTSRAWLALPVVLIVVITIVDVHSPANVHLGPALVIAPAVTAAFAGPVTTGLVSLLALAGQVIIAALHGGLATTNHVVQLITLALLSALVVSVCIVRERQGRELAQVRSVAEAAQHVLLWPLPKQIGPLRVACLYLAAEEEARIGGDLYAATRTDDGVRVMIGDVRGKGLSAIGEAALLLGAFREAAHQHTTLPALAAALEQSVARYLTDFEPPEEVGERFATTLLMEIPDNDHITRMTSCGHPPPLLLSPGGSAAPLSLHPAPPLGVGLSDADGYTLDVFTFQPGDTLLLYTDGVTEARNASGAFYPITERAAHWTEHNPETLLHHLRQDLLAHVGGRLEDDAALIALHRAPAARPSHHVTKAIHADGFRHRP